ncbi:class I SAM-dependent methyltransferase [Flagellimonas algicola]|uniref:Class I SAM-dependent methyltransferase n=1 Tax=Flagellimonas algicola TaxID=2583815 RepID=A0ABY2WR65_9FLAO|nr:class I SAM-dependent methyltransferase [Allomuricauda algicola]
MNPLQRFIHKIFSLTGFGRLLLANYLLQKKFLFPMGWSKSVRTGKPVLKNGNELPWFTYSFIAFLEKRIHGEMSIFEYGSGNSTLWFAKKGCTLVSVEHDENWYRQMQLRLDSTPKIEYLWRDLESKAYSQEILNYSRAFDIIVLDGRDRVNCCLNALNSLKEDGVIIWDNSDREEYLEGYQFLESNSFKRLDFHGLGPINSGKWCTSVFYRKDNCLNI